MSTPVHPCGTICDLIRTSYTTGARLWADDTTVVPILWYRCPEGAKPGPFVSIYRSKLWDDKEASPVPTVGDVPGARFGPSATEVKWRLLRTTTARRTTR